MMKDERLAVTLERIAADPDTFYTGDLADDIGEPKIKICPLEGAIEHSKLISKLISAEDLKQVNSIITKEDLEKFEATITGILTFFE